jgi:3-hydroxyisobutyrate dehydrogenase-like beta-hydroxyacid dehydrogenase
MVTAEITAWLLGQEIDPRMFRQVIRATGSNATERVEEFFRRNERTGGTLSNIRKDLRQALAVARARETPLLLTALVDQLAETAAKRTGDRIRPSAAFAALYEALAHVDMSQSVIEAVNAEVRDARQSKVVYVGNFRE